jgi:hypothetical protein
MTIDGAEMTSGAVRTRRRARRTVAGLGVVAAGLVVWSVPSQAQTGEPAPATNFNMAGVADPASGQMLAVDANVTGNFAFCNNPNGLGAELYLEGGDGAGMTVRHATVTPFVVPIHVGLLTVVNPDPENTLDDEMLTLGVAQGTPIEFGASGTADVEYGGVFFGSGGAGLVNWRYSAAITCTDSVVMPILEPLINGGTAAATAPATTDTTIPAPTTTDTTIPAPTTTDSTVPPATTETTVP